MNHLFLFTITPVQSFIEQARKTQDMWAGSRILSDLIKEVIIAIRKKNGDVIFPNVDDSKLSTIESLSNRVLANLDLSEGFDFKTYGNEIAAVVQTKLYGYTQKAKEQIGISEFSKIESSFIDQLKDYFSTFWVFVPIENNDYEAAYEKANRLLGGIKNSRTFSQFPEQGRKCSLSGEQNALIFGKGTNPDYIKLNSAIKTHEAIVDKNEGLSAISYIKRFYRKFYYSDKFDSTADIALLYTKNEHKEAFDEFESIFTILRAVEKEKCLKFDNKDWTEFDEQFYFEENLTLKNIPCNNQLEIAKKHHGFLKDALKTKKNKFTKYYAILVFDADSMGKWLSGEYLTDESILKLEAFQKHLSSLLLGFADYAKNYVDGKGEDERQKGRTVYAGGDDYVGFINLHYLFDVLQHLREKFKELVSDKLKKDNEFALRLTQDLSFSAGVSIAHYKTPLSEVLRWARSMEHEAKEIDGKNSFGIAVLKHSGEIHKTVLGFVNQSSTDFSEKLRSIVKLLDTDFSNTFIKTIEAETTLIGMEEMDYDFIDIIQFELKRQIKRSKKLKDAHETTMGDSVIEILKYSKTNFDGINQIINFYSALNICDFITRKLSSND